jgi:hypothetical protein
MHEFLKFIFGVELYMFRTVSLSIIRSLALYTQHTLYDIYLLLCVQYSWLWTEKLSETRGVVFQK